MKTTKQDLLSQLTNAKNNYILSLAASAAFADQRTQAILNDASCHFGAYHISFVQVSQLLGLQADREIVLKEFINSALRALTKESFELVKNYCEKTHQHRKLTSQSWYLFHSHIRNCLSHNFCFKFQDHHLKKLPVTWNNKTITSEMQNIPLELSFFGYYEAWELFLQLVRFVETDLD